ncbi:MAG: hydroxyacid dehydrogenase, partial [Chloroflexi bacterium]|nr:hydroxyacid dehydrogenase [Chloroflexota bacterium]
MARRVRVVFFECAPPEAATYVPKLADQAVDFRPAPLGARTAAAVRAAEVVSVFIGSRVDAEVLARLPKLRLIATRSTG